MTKQHLRRPLLWAVALAAAVAQATVTVTTAVLADAGGLVVALVAVGVTAILASAGAVWALRRARDLERTNAALTAIWERSPQPMLRVDDAAAVVDANPPARALLGDAPERGDAVELVEAVGESITPSQVVSDGLPVDTDGDVEVTYRRPDGTETLVALSAAALPDADG